MASPNPIVSESMKKVLDRQRGANERDFGGLNVSLQGYDVPGALRQYRNEPYPTPVAEDLTRIFTQHQNPLARTQDLTTITMNSCEPDASGLKVSTPSGSQQYLVTSFREQDHFSGYPFDVTSPTAQTHGQSASKVLYRQQMQKGLPEKYETIAQPVEAEATPQRIERGLMSENSHDMKANLGPPPEESYRIIYQIIELSTDKQSNQKYTIPLSKPQFMEKVKSNFKSGLSDAIKKDYFGRTEPNYSVGSIVIKKYANSSNPQYLPIGPDDTLESLAPQCESIIEEGRRIILLKIKMETNNKEQMSLREESIQLKEEIEKQKQLLQQKQQEIQSIELAKEQEEHRHQVKELIDQQIRLSTQSFQQIIEEKIRINSLTLQSEFQKYLENQAQPAIQPQPHCHAQEALMSREIEKKEKEESEVPDLVFFYSSPLVDEKLNEITGKRFPQAVASDTLQTEIEYQRLVDALKSTQRQFIITREAINFQSLNNQISRGPKIIHISCHGDQDGRDGQFHLVFEDQGPARNGMSDKFNEERLKQLLGTETNHDIKLAFVSACRSEKIGQLLHNCGIPIVVAVNSDTKVADEVCLLFSRNFYLSLLQGKSVANAFEEARRVCKGRKMQCKSCCCSHSHEKNCKWEKYACEFGYDKAHELHSGNCSCNMGMNKHKINCQIYQKFKKELRKAKKEDESLEKVKGLSAQATAQGKTYSQDIYAQISALPFDSDDFEDMLPPDEKEAILCCCKQGTDHDEEMKFKIIAEKDEDKVKIFPKREKGSLIQLQHAYIKDKIPNIQDQNFLIGRKVDIYTCVKYLTNEKYETAERLIVIQSSQGEGKTEIAQYSVKYCCERKFFQDGAYFLEIGSGWNCSDFERKVCQILKYNDFDDLIECIKDQHIVLILSYCDEILHNDKQSFEYLVLMKLIDQTTFLKLVLLMEKETDTTLLNRCNNMLEIKCLPKYYAAKMLKAFDKYEEINELQKFENVAALKEHNIFTYNLTKDEIFDIFRLLKMKNDQTLDGLTQIILQKRKQQSSIMGCQKYNVVQQIEYQNIKQQFPAEINLINLLSQCPSGLTLVDMQNIIGGDLSYGNWHQFLDSMIVNKDGQDQSKQLEPDGHQCQSYETSYEIISYERNDELGQNVYKLKKQMRSFINDSVLQNQRSQQFYQFLTYFSDLSLQYMQALKLQQSRDFDLMILSAEIEDGIFQCTKDPSARKVHFGTSQNRMMDQDHDLDDVVARFNINESNFKELLDYNTISNIFKNYQLEFPDLTVALDQLYIVYPTILLMMDRQNSATEALTKIEMICNYFCRSLYRNKDDKQENTNLSLQTQAKISLLKLSLELNTNRSSNIDRVLNECEILIQQIDNDLWKAEIQYFKAICYIKKIEQQQLIEDQHAKYSVQNILGAGVLQTFKRRLSIKRTNSIEEISKIFSSNIAAEDYYQKINNEVQNCSAIYKQHSQQVCEARAILLKATLRFNIKALGIPVQKEDLEKAKSIFRLFGFPQHEGTCLKFLSLIECDNGNYAESKNIIDNAIEQAQTLMFYQQETELREILAVIQRGIQSTISNNLIVFLNSFPINNQIDHASENKNQEQEQQSFYQNNYVRNELAKYSTLMPFQEFKKELNIKYDILNIKQLKNIRDYGCKILVLDSFINNSNQLYIEDQDGLPRLLTTEELEEVLNPEQAEELTDTQLAVDTVFILTNNAYEIARIFKKYGVPQILMLKQNYQFEDYEAAIADIEQEWPPSNMGFGPDMAREGIERVWPGPIDTNVLLKTISVEIIKKLIGQQTFQQAYSTISQQFENCPIEWFETGSSDKNEKLFDDAQKDQRYQLKAGKVEDQSQANVASNIEASYNPIIGRKQEIAALVKLILNPLIKTVNLHGVEGVGKTRIVDEIAQFMIMRDIFKDGVYFLDFKNAANHKNIDHIFKNAGIEYLLNAKKSSDKSQKMKKQDSEDGKQMVSVKTKRKILLIYDNIDQIDPIIFKLHLKQLNLQPIDIKILLTKKKSIDNIQNGDRIENIHLKALSNKESIELVKLYSMRDFEIDEFDHACDSSCSGHSSHEGSDPDQIQQLLNTEPRIEKCQGIPQNLIILAFVLRNFKMNQIRIKVSSNLSKYASKQEANKQTAQPLSFHDDIKEVNDQQNRRPTLQGQIEQFRSALRKNLMRKIKHEKMKIALKKFFIREIQKKEQAIGQDVDESIQSEDLSREDDLDMRESSNKPPHSPQQVEETKKYNNLNVKEESNENSLQVPRLENNPLLKNEQPINPKNQKEILQQPLQDTRKNIDRKQKDIKIESNVENDLAEAFGPVPKSNQSKPKQLGQATVPELKPKKLSQNPAQSVMVNEIVKLQPPGLSLASSEIDSKQFESFKAHRQFGGRGLGRRATAQSNANEANNAFKPKGIQQYESQRGGSKICGSSLRGMLGGNSTRGRNQYDGKEEVDRASFEHQCNVKVMGRFAEIGKQEIELLKYIDYRYLKIFMNVEFNEQLKSILNDHKVIRNDLNFIQINKQILQFFKDQSRQLLEFKYIQTENEKDKLKDFFENDIIDHIDIPQKQPKVTIEEPGGRSQRSARSRRGSKRNVQRLSLTNQESPTIQPKLRLSGASQGVCTDKQQEDHPLKRLQTSFERNGGLKKRGNRPIAVGGDRHLDVSVAALIDSDDEDGAVTPAKDSGFDDHEEQHACSPGLAELSSRQQQQQFVMPVHIKIVIPDRRPRAAKFAD